MTGGKRWWIDLNFFQGKDQGVVGIEQSEKFHMKNATMMMKRMTL